jgi:hypothetical protein
LTTNLKMAGSGLVPCPEVEQKRPCQFFGKGFCPSCYSEDLFPMRLATSRHTHNKTERHGLIRLGTYIEITADLWAQFKAGRGKWDCCGLMAKELRNPELRALVPYGLSKAILEAVSSPDAPDSPTRAPREGTT